MLLKFLFHCINTLTQSIIPTHCPKTNNVPYMSSSTAWRRWWDECPKQWVFESSCSTTMGGSMPRRVTSDLIRGQWGIGARCRIVSSFYLLKFNATRTDFNRSRHFHIISRGHWGRLLVSLRRVPDELLRGASGCRWLNIMKSMKMR